ncbi:MAG: CinA family nicotinamide mononucleotide deamidase-related protein [Desulfurivibrionaceae bacterium]
MKGEIIAVGDELTSGRVVNSTSYFAASHLYAAGHEIIAMATVGDSPERIVKAIREAIDRADFLVVTGGLGSTSDDLTTAAAAEALNRPTIFYPEIFAKIRESEMFKESPSLEKLAWLPSGAEVLKPGEKIAGYMLVYNQKPVFFLPGVPHQMRELMLDRVIPRLASWEGGEQNLVRQKVYKVFGLEESYINNILAELENSYRHLRIGYYPMAAEVHVSLTVRGRTKEEMDELFNQGEEFIRKNLGFCIYDEDGETMELITGRLLQENGLSLALAESCTGGLLSHYITKVPGSSAYFPGGVVAYSNKVKEQLLGVSGSTLVNYGAVSRETVRAMASGVKRALGSDIGLAVSGIAGPSGGTKEKPVGMVCFGLSASDYENDYVLQFSGRREMVQIKAAYTGLDILRRHLLGISDHTLCV